MRKIGTLVLSLFIVACGGSSTSENDAALLSYSGVQHEANFERLNNEQLNELIRTATIVTNKAIQFSHKPDEEIYFINYMRSVINTVYNKQPDKHVGKTAELCTPEEHHSISVEAYAENNIDKIIFNNSCFLYAYTDNKQVNNNDEVNAALSLAQLLSPNDTDVKNDKKAELIISGSVIARKSADEFSLKSLNISSTELDINVLASGKNYLINEDSDQVTEIGQVFKCGESNCYIKNIGFVLFSYLNKTFSQARRSINQSDNHGGFDTLSIPLNSSCAANCEGINNMVYNPYAGLNTLLNDGIRVSHHEHGAFSIKANSLVPCEQKTDTAFQSGEMILKDGDDNELKVTFHSCANKPVSELLK